MPVKTILRKDKKLIDRYEQMRETALSKNTYKIKTRGMGVLAQKGMTDWMKVISEFQPESLQKIAPLDNRKPTALAAEFDLNVDLTNILAEMTLKNLMEGAQT